MKCIQIQSSFVPLHSQAIHKRQLKTDKLLWPSSQETTRLVKHRQNMAMRRRAITNPLILGVNSPAKGGDISVLLQTGAVLLLAYGIANFLVPALISKDYGFDKLGKEPTANDESASDDEEGDMPSSKKPKPQTPTQGFKSTRT